MFNVVDWAPSLSKESLLLSVISEQQRCPDDRPELTRAKFTPEAVLVLTLVPECSLILWDSLGLPVCRVLQHPSVFLSFAGGNREVEVGLGVGEGSPA